MSERTLLAARHARLSEALSENGLNALVVNASPSLVYLTGLHFHMSERPVVAVFPSGGARPHLVVPGLEALKAADAQFDVTVHTYDERPESWQPAFSKAMNAAGLAKGGAIGVEPGALRVLELRFLEAASPAAQFVSGAAAVAALRARKDEGELALMRKAVEIAQGALEATLSSLKTGVTEREISAVLIQNMLRLGSGGELPFQPIIAFGANSANPHAVPTDYALQPGDLALFDWGANYQGYFSDLTRTFAYGDIPDELKTTARLVEEANGAGRAKAGPGVAAGAVDGATRAVIVAGGYGPQFSHRTGHGLGLEVHEEPYIRGDNKELLEPGMTFTIEPGIYLTGKGGVRIEDDMVITADGCESLSDYPRPVRTLPVR